LAWWMCAGVGRCLYPAPICDKYPNGHRIAGVAAASGALDELKHYGWWVLPLVFETGGPVSLEGKRSLETMAQRAGAAAIDNWALSKIVSMWHSALERCVVWSMADVDLLALGRSAPQVLHGARCNRAARGAGAASQECRRVSL
jgi:hypothetical protein